MIVVDPFVVAIKSTILVAVLTSVMAANLPRTKDGWQKRLIMVGGSGIVAMLVAAQLTWSLAVAALAMAYAASVAWAVSASQRPRQAHFEEVGRTLA